MEGDTNISSEIAQHYGKIMGTTQITMKTMHLPTQSLKNRWEKAWHKNMKTSVVLSSMQYAARTFRIPYFK